MFRPDKKLTAKKCYECWIIVKNYRQNYRYYIYTNYIQTQYIIIITINSSLKHTHQINEQKTCDIKVKFMTRKYSITIKYCVVHIYFGIEKLFNLFSIQTIQKLIFQFRNYQKNSLLIFFDTSSIIETKKREGVAVGKGNNSTQLLCSKFVKYCQEGKLKLVIKSVLLITSGYHFF